MHTQEYMYKIDLSFSRTLGETWLLDLSSSESVEQRRVRLTQLLG